MDADAVAATNLIDNILMSYEKRKKKLEYIQIFSVEDLFELWGFSIACVFMKFELDIKSNYDPNSYYLPNDARYLLVVEAAKQHLLSYIRNKVISYTVDVKKYDSAIENGRLEAEKLFRLYSRDLSFTISLTNNREKYEFFSAEVMNNWANNLRPRLKQYSRTILFLEEETEQAIKDMKKGKIYFELKKTICKFSKSLME